MVSPFLFWRFIGAGIGAAAVAGAYAEAARRSVAAF